MFRKNHRNVFRFFIVLGALFICYPKLVYADEKMPVQIYMGGKSYLSLDEYKQEQFEEQLKQIVTLYENETPDEISHQLRSEISSIYLKNISKEELLQIIRKVRAKSKKNVVKEDQKINQFEEMQLMLDDYSIENKSSETIMIDPDKVKTFVIKPSEKKVLP